jgi:hypothetical protein
MIRIVKYLIPILFAVGQLIINAGTLPTSGHPLLEIDSISYSDSAITNLIDTNIYCKGKYGYMAGKVVCCDGKSNIGSQIYYFLEHDSSIIVKFGRKTEPDSDDAYVRSDYYSRFFASDCVLPGVYSLRICPGQVYSSNKGPEARYDSTYGVLVEEMGQDMCGDVLVFDIRVSPDSISIVNVKLPFNYSESIDRFSPVVKRWWGDIIPLRPSP